MVTKLKAVYTLVEQLYTGSQRALAVVALSNEVPTHLAKFFAGSPFCFNVSKSGDGPLQEPERSPR